MNVLVLGGTGAMGVHLVSLIAQYAKRVAVTSRSRSGIKDNIEYLTGNARDNAFIRNLLRQHWDVIIDFMVYPTRAFKDRYKLFLNSTSHYIYLSSSRVYAESDKALTEDSPRLLDTSSDKIYLSTDEYALSKARQENLLFDSSKKNWSIIRPYITYGDERLQLGVLEKEDWLYRALKRRTLVTSYDINSRQTTLTHGRDVSRGINAILGQSRTYGETFHITSSSTIEWSEVLTLYLDTLEAHLGYRPRVVMQKLKQFMQWRGGQYQIIYDRLYNRQFDNSKINQYIATKEFITPREGLSRCLESLLANNTTQHFNSLNWREEAIKDRMVGEHTPLRDIPGLKQKTKYCLFRHIPLLKTI